MSRRKKINFLQIIILLFVFFFIAIFFLLHFEFKKTDTGLLTVNFLDVGQGDAIFIESPSGAQMLIDGGKGISVLRELGSVMSFFDRSIDVVLATHPDMDHIGGLPEVFKRYEIGMFIESGVTDDGSDNVALENYVGKEGLTPVYARQGMNVDLGAGVMVEILFPDRDVSGVNPNVGSIVCRLTYKNISMLFTGDSPVAIEEYLVSNYGDELKSNVLKLGHHGSKTSSSEVFLKAVKPSIAIISAGCDNRYGHPNKSVIERLDELKIRKINTCKYGTITITTDGESVYLR